MAWLPSSEVLLAGVSALGIGSIAGAYFTARLQRRTNADLKEFEERLRRYRSTAVWMQVYLHPEHTNHLPVEGLHSATREEVRATLAAEYSHMVLFAPDPVLRAVRAFIQRPSEAGYWTALIEMRQALWGKTTRLDAADLNLDLPGSPPAA